MATLDSAPLVVYFDLGDTLFTTHPPSWIPDAQALLATLRDKGIRLGVISNTDGLDRAGLAPYLPPGFEWSAFDPDLILLSGEVGVEKPDAAIFKLALERSAGAATVFCTESLPHSIASQLAGLPCLRVVPERKGDLAQVATVLHTVGFAG